MKNITLISLLFLASTFIKAQEVKINNNLVIEADGTLRMDSSATVWDDLRVTLDKGQDAAKLGFLPGASAGPEIWYFRDVSGVEAMSFTVQLPHSWKQGTRIYPHIHWTPKSSASGNVEWNFEYSWTNYDPVTPQVFPAITTNTIVVTGPFTLGTHLITPLTAANVGLDATGKKVSSVLVCRIWRNSINAADTYAADAGGISIDFHYEMDTFGSRSEYSK